MDLREEFDRILGEYGHYVLLHRTSRKIRCICWNEKYKESSVELYLQRTRLRVKLDACPRCLGSGWVSKIERHQVRRDNASQTVSLPDLKKQLIPGQLATGARVFYLRWNAAPQIGDYFYEVGWNDKRPTHLIQAYQINAVEDLRGLEGRTEYFLVVCREANIDTDIRRLTLRKIGPIENYEFVKGGVRR